MRILLLPTLVEIGPEQFLARELAVGATGLEGPPLHAGDLAQQAGRFMEQAQVCLNCGLAGQVQAQEPQEEARSSLILGLYFMVQDPRG
jgi:hypothetical protein